MPEHGLNMRRREGNSVTKDRLMEEHLNRKCLNVMYVP